MTVQPNIVLLAVSSNQPMQKHVAAHMHVHMHLMHMSMPASDHC